MGTKSLLSYRFSGITLLAVLLCLLRMRRVLLAPRNEGIPKRRTTVRPNKPPYGAPPGKGRRWWSSLSAQLRIKILTPYFENNWTNKELEALLGLTIGRIARTRDNRNMELKVKAAEAAPQPVPKPAKKRKRRKEVTAPTPAPSPEPPTPEPPPAPAPTPTVAVALEKATRTRVVSTKLTTDWRKMCIHKDEKNHQCGYIKLPGSESCGRPGHDK